MESVPTGRVEIVRLAVLLRPPPGVRVALPSAVAPSMKTTEPVGAAYWVANVAVKVTGWLKLEGLCEEATTALLMKAGLMICENAAEVDAPKLPVPA
jgi:hypothetical protein